MDKNITLNKKTFLKPVTTFLTAAFLIIGCASTTNTGSVGVDRKQLMLVSQQQVLQMSTQAHQKLLASARAKKVLDTDPALLSRLRRIANDLTPHVAVYRPNATNWQWQLNTIKSDKINAFVLAGGKIVFFSGIVNELKLTDDEIAAIMGHEIAHALREHTRERMSSSQLTQFGIGLAASSFKLSNGEAQLASIAGDLGINLPHSRVQESEADIMGLELMARAGYKPQAAITLWQKMQQHKSGRTPQFLSTHPNSNNRIIKLQKYLPQVSPLYQQATAKSNTRPPSTSQNPPNNGGVVFKTYQP